MGKNRFLDNILSEAQQYYNENKIIGGFPKTSKTRQQLYTQFLNLMAGVANMMTGTMDSNNSIAIGVAVAAASPSSPSPSSPSSSPSSPSSSPSQVSTNVDSTIPIGVAVAAASPSSPVSPNVDSSIPIGVAIAAASSPSQVSTNVDSSIPIGVAVAAASNEGGDGGTGRGTGITSPMTVIIEKAKKLSENLKSIVDNFIKEQKETQGDLDEETGKLILGEPNKPNAIILTPEGTSYLPDYKDGLTNDDIVFRK